MNEHANCDVNIKDSGIMRKCSYCGKQKPESFFGKDKKGKRRIA